MARRTQNINKLVLFLVNIFVIIFFIVSLWNYVNTSFFHSFTTAANNPGQLTSDRVTNIFYWAQAIGIIRILIILFTTLRLSDTKDSWYRKLQTIFSVIFILFEITVIVIYAIEAGSCNKDPSTTSGAVFNMCNDYRYCCVFGTIDGDPKVDETSVLEGCPLLLKDCDPGVNKNDLRMNSDFFVGFTITVFMLIFGVIYLISGILLGDGTIKKDPELEEEEEEEEELNEEGKIEENNRLLNFSQLTKKNKQHLK